MDNVIALGRGDPDFHTPRHIVEAAKKALDENKHHYTPPTGLPELRKSISKNLSFRDAFLEGAFTVPGDGCIDYKPVLDQLKKNTSNFK